MTDVFSEEDRSRVMSKVHGKNTAPELKVRRLLHALGYRYTLHEKTLPGHPDIVFTRRRKAIFVHGCFWHQHPGCKAADRPSSNTGYWQKKLERNIERDLLTTQTLEEKGWKVFIVWECEIRSKNRETALAERLSFFLGPPRISATTTPYADKTEAPKLTD